MGTESPSFDFEDIWLLPSSASASLLSVGGAGVDALEVRLDCDASGIGSDRNFTRLPRKLWGEVLQVHTS